MKNEVVIKDKFTRYRIGHRFKYNPTTKKRNPTGVNIFIYDYGNKLVFKTGVYEYNIKDNKCSFYGQWGQKLVLSKYKDNWNLYEVNHRKEYIPCINKSTSIHSVYYKIFGKKGINKEEQARVNRILRRFCKNNNIKLRIKNTDAIDSVIRTICYPSVKGLQINKDLSIPYSRLFRKLPLKEIIRKTFGNKGKNTCKLIYSIIEKEKNLEIFHLGNLIKGLLEPNHIHELLKLRKEYSYIGILSWKPIEDIKNIRNFLKRFNAPTRYRLCINQDFVTLGHNLLDTIRLMDTVIANGYEIPQSPESLRDLHDRLIAIQNEYYRRESSERAKLEEEKLKKPYEYKEKLQLLKNAIVDDMTIDLPENGLELREWGRLMHNCVGSYDNSVRNGTIILGIKKQDKLVYNISINNKIIGQFFAACNQRPNSNDEIKIINYLYNTKVISKKPPMVKV